MSNFKDAMFRFWTGLHRAAFRGTGGKLFPSGAGMPFVMLTTTGRKTGKPRQTMLNSPVQDGQTVVLVASYGGDDRHPAWFLNLRANPDVEILMNGTSHRMRARVADAAEKEALWPKITARFRGYGNYQRRTDRDIPVVLLTPRD